MNAKMMGLIVSKKKSKIMSVNSGATRSVNIDGEPLEHIERVHLSRECDQASVK